MKQQITNIILEMVGENYFVAPDGINDYDFGYNQAIQDIREKVPETADRIEDEIYIPAEYNTAQKYVLKTALENLGEMDDEQYEFIRNNLLDRFK